MNTRVTLHDIAREAGVSPATVDRVLNNREGVRRRTREVVLDVATRLGYVSQADVPDIGRQPAVRHRFVFLFPAGTNTFIKFLARQIEEQSLLRPELEVRIETLEGFNPTSLAARLFELQGKTDGIGLIAQDHPLVREAIRALAFGGTPVVTIASDIQNVPRLAYVGIDNRQAGRLAGLLMARFLAHQSAPVKVALFAGSLSYRGHEEREMGFRLILREEFPALQIVDVREILDDRQKAEVETTALLDQHPDLAGIYSVGAGAYGIARALKTRGVDKSIVLIGHEATEGNKQLLLDGSLDAVIDQNPRVEAREALNLLTAAAAKKPYRFIPPRLQVVFRENLPDD